MLNTKTDATDSHVWQFKNFKRWEIIAVLKTESFLHIGDGSSISKKVQDSQGKEREVEVNSIITDKDDLPIIPGSTLKGRLRNYLKKNLIDIQLLEKVFGSENNNEDNLGRGGLAEFHDGRLLLQNHNPTTCIETSTAINRHSKTALDGSLHYTECVVPETKFEIKVTGTMEDSHAALVCKALEILGGGNGAIFLGAEDANGKGRVMLSGKINVKQLGYAEIIEWLENDSDKQMATSFFKKFDYDKKVKELIKKHINPKLKTDIQVKEEFDIKLYFDGPFIVNNPDNSRDQDQPNFYPLLDKDDNPVLPVRSFRGAFRAQAERIIRTLGGKCCDNTPENSCKGKNDLCIACELFGSTGWKTTLEIDNFKYVNSENYPCQNQDFVAIDRFGGGGKDGAKFNAAFCLSPIFKSTITIAERIKSEGISWRKGMLALLFRDLKEGDINFGFGINKGYGSIKKAQIKCCGNQYDSNESDIQTFIDKCKKNEGDYHCDKVKEPKSSEDNNIADLPTINPSDVTDSKFHNPYHFIPLKTPDTTNWTPKNKYATDKSPHSHGFYRNKTDDGKPLYHGRIICKLTSETPFFIGAQDADNQVEGESILKDPYKLNGELAIPATSLRGMISSLSEAASNSAMRVLDTGGIISYRKPMEPSMLLSALGMVTKRENGFHLIPLALPTLKRSGKGYTLDNIYKKMFPDGTAKLRVYLNNAYKEEKMKTFIKNVESWTLDTNRIYYLPLDSVKLENGMVDQSHTCLRHPSRRQFVIGQKPRNGNYIPSSKKDSGMVPGILRVLGKNHREKDMPKDKKHELFIPVPQDFVTDLDNFLKNAGAFLIPPDVISDFEKIAEKQTKSQKQESITHDEERLPFNLKGTSREDDYTLKIKQGDIVYFCPDPSGKEIAEISFSSIWRKKVEGAFHDFVPAVNLLPFNENRTHLSPAELLFGFTESNEDSEKHEHGLAYSGKVRISAGILAPESAKKHDNELLGEEVKLKALSTPKPPSPALYFKNKNGTNNYITKSILNRNKHIIQGRKMYLHGMRKKNNSAEIQKITSAGRFPEKAEGNFPWVSQNNDRDHLKVRFRPIKEGNDFYFHLDFNNLTKWEIGLFCYVLQPNESFRHKIGMGKPLGLGTVKIDIASLQTINRYNRYSNTKQDDDRYNEGGIIKGELQKEMLDIYKDISKENGILKPDELKKLFVNTMDADIYRAIELLGDPGNIRSPVHYPQVDSIGPTLADIEKENFKWFVKNESEGKREMLEPIAKDTIQMKPFSR